MFVLPPPPRYPTQAAYNAALAAGHVAPMIETNNILSTPEDQFLVGEGTYVLKEDLLLATPPPHPSEAPVINPNPLATNPQPATAGTKVSLLSLEARRPPPAFYRLAATAALPGSIAEHPNEWRLSNDAKISSDGEGRGTSVSDVGGPGSATAVSAPAFGNGNALLAPERFKDPNKRRKPKNNMTKSNSSFISRVIINEAFSKKMSDRPNDGVFAFANINRAFQWLDFSSPTKADYLTKILFTKAHCLSHDVNLVTKSSGHIDIIMGFSTGEIIWWEAMSQRYTRLNKNGVINKTPVSQIRWIPGAENLFLAAHMDGSLVVYDKEKEDAVFNPEEEEVQSNGENTPPNFKLSDKISRINAFTFSPDNRHLAVVSEDGTMRIIDYLKEELIGLYNAYYGGFTCVCWSPDGKYVLTGGQDDLISIWYPQETTLIARCQGHQSWVTSVAFDPWRCDEKNYRFGSVGEDCRLCLWDFNVGMLHKPKIVSLSKPMITDICLTFSRRTDNAVQFRPVYQPCTEPKLRIADKDPLSWITFTEESIMTSCKTGHIRTWSRPSDSLTQLNNET
ncbi:hypothetical protein CHU98_g2075 [Xylaria longipes]|nr:hypothetical protein CHU98_g2075 [Xylaria longipes]